MKEIVERLESYKGRIIGFEILALRSASFDGAHGDQLVEEVDDDSAEFFGLYAVGVDKETIFLAGFDRREDAFLFMRMVIAFSSLWIGSN